jgi:hypothetical protein
MPPSSSTGLLDDIAAMLRDLQVAGHQHGLASFVLYEFLDLVGLFGLVEKGNQNVCAFACVGDGDRPTDAAVAAGDDGLHPIQLARALVADLAVIRTRLHCVG